MAQQASPKGLAYLELKENVVLKAYRDIAGTWTIGPGLTAASGVVVPKAGMTITLSEARNLMQAALRHNYEPRVIKALGQKLKQNVFDGAVSFDWNTGAIDRASWVKALKAGDAEKTRTGLMAWIKSGGKVVRGLQIRRAEEADIILLDKWPAVLKVTPLDRPLQPNETYALWVVDVTAQEIADIREQFRVVGFDPGQMAGKVLRIAVEDFQRKYALTVDGKIGRATLATLQREVNARGATKVSGTVAAGGGAVATGNEIVAPPQGHLPGSELIGDQLVTWFGIGVGVVGVIWLGYQAWHYRDMIAARVQGVSPRLAGWLRSF